MRFRMPRPSSLWVVSAYVDFKAEAQLFVGIDRSDERIVQAGSGVAGLIWVSVVVHAEYAADAAVFEELGAAVPVD
ncbi:hypothetical protein Tco_1081788 [Tanacetum coccineum]|uniref:Uncharacterized protein n=1 Tax=Tanacetum coccineum TaxID=301880 RepID=A0ABQ5HYP4_9ASTR